MIRALALAFAIVGVTPAADAFNYVDKRGYRHWCKSSCGKHRFARPRPAHTAPRTFSVIITKLPPDPEPAPAAPSAPAAVVEEEKPEFKIPLENNPATSASPYGALVPLRPAVPTGLFKPKGAE